MLARLFKTVVTNDAGRPRDSNSDELAVEMTQALMKNNVPIPGIELELFIRLFVDRKHFEGLNRSQPCFFSLATPLSLSLLQVHR